MGYFVKNRMVGRRPTGPAIPVGNTTDRPANPAVGTLRYNTDIDTYEFWNGIVYSPIGVQGDVNLKVDTFTANGIQASFTMTSFVSQSNQSLVFVGGVYQIPGTDYTTSGFDLQFTTPPPVDNIVNVVHNIGSTVVSDSIFQVDPGSLLDLNGGAYPDTFDPTPDDPADGGTYDPVDTSPPGTHYDGGTYA